MSLLMPCSTLNRAQDKMPSQRAQAGRRRPHVELAIHWSPINVQRVMALVDPGAECNGTWQAEQFLATVHIWMAMMTKTCSKACVLTTGNWKAFYAMYTVLTCPSFLEYILGIDVLKGLVLRTSVGAFHLQVRVVKAIVRGYAKQVLPTTPAEGSDYETISCTRQPLENRRHHC